MIVVVVYPFLAISIYHSVSATPQMSRSGRCDEYTHHSVWDARSGASAGPNTARETTPMIVSTARVPRKKVKIETIEDRVSSGAPVDSRAVMAASQRQVRSHGPEHHQGALKHRQDDRRDLVLLRRL